MRIFMEGGKEGLVIKPQKTLGMFLGLVFGLIFFGGYIWGVNFSISEKEMALRIILLLPAYIILVGYLFVLYGLASLGYVIGEDGLIIRWAHKRYEIPWNEIKQVSRVSGRINLVNILGISWPGYAAGTYDLKGIGALRLFATRLKEILVIDTGKGMYGITSVPELLPVLEEKTDKEIKFLDLYELPDSVIGRVVNEDIPYLVLMALNVIALATLGAYLAIFFPGSGASSSVVLLVVLALAIFAFNLANAPRIFNYMPYGGYLIWFIGLTVNVAFIAMSMSTVGFK